MTDINEIRDFCSEHINGLNQSGREEIFDILRMHVNDSDIDSDNSDGSRIYINKISNECFVQMYKAILKWLE
jgi:hypothetical protein